MDSERNNKSDSYSHQNSPRKQDKFKFSFRDFKKHNVITILSTLIVDFLIFVAGVYIKTPQSLLYAGFGILIITIIVCTILIMKQQESKKYKFFVGIISIIIILVLSWGFHKLIYQETNMPINCDNPQTLMDYFQCDFSNATTFSLRKNMTFTNDTETFEAHMEIEINMDFNALSYFFKFYLYECNGTFIVCTKIPELCNQIRNNPLYQKIAIPDAFRNNAKTLNDLTFSKRVYIYHETHLFPLDVVFLDSLLRTEDIIPEFRSQTSYADLHPPAQNYKSGDSTSIHMYLKKDSIIQYKFKR